MKAAPVQATQYVKLGSLIKGIDVFAMKGCTKELIVFKVNLGVILMLKKRRTNIKKAKANKKKHKIWQAASFKKKMIKNKFIFLIISMMLLPIDNFSGEINKKVHNQTNKQINCNNLKSKTEYGAFSLKY